MQEIVPNVYIETGYAGVTLGAINWPHGLVLIDAPFRPEDTRSWRSALLNLGGGVDRVLVQLDAHPDRTLGATAARIVKRLPLTDLRAHASSAPVIPPTSPTAIPVHAGTSSS